MKPHVPSPKAVGHYAGAFSRLAAYAIDFVLVTTLFSGLTAVLLWVAQLVTARHVDGTDLGTVASAILFGAWFLSYFGLSWAIAGRTPGMTLLGLRVVRRDGSHLGGKKAALRAVTFPLSFVPLGLGFIGILVGRERRAFHDVCADTTVVYDWDVQATRLRSLAHGRQAAARSAT